MTFKRPKDITLTQMAQWVDANIIDGKDQDKLVEYLYHLSYHNAQKRSLFSNTDYEKYDDFAIFCVTKLLTRFNNKRCQPVKSVVNYINNVLYPWHAEYIRCFCSGDADSPVEDFDVTDFADYLVDVSSDRDFNSYDVYYARIGTVIRNYLSRIPRKRKSAEWSNIYLSCLLTLQDRIENAIKFSSTTEEDDTKYLSRMIRSLKNKEPVLYHLDESMASYVSVLVNELIHAIANELTYSTHSYVSPSACLKNLVIAASNDEEDQ